jgi:hypothetical protein
VFFADSHVEALPASEATLTSPKLGIGYVGANNAPHYVPDWHSW